MAGQQRRYPRRPKPSIIWYHILDGTPHEREGLAIGVNASQSGVGIVATEPMSVGARVFVHMHFRSDDLTSVMRVTRSRELDGGKWDIGMEIDVISPDERVRMRRLFG